MMAQWILVSLGKQFMRAVNVSIAASWLILAVLVLRIALKKGPKWVSVVLWGLVAIRLVMPFPIETGFSMVPSAETFPVNSIYSSDPSIANNVFHFQVESGISAIDQNSHLLQDVSAGATLRSNMGILGIVWVTGVASLIIYGFVSFIRLRRKVVEAIPYQNNIWLCDHIASPFILGIFRPRIYLPSGQDEKETEYVLAHERAHLKRKDHFWKPVGFLLLSIYWFNPLVWIAYILLCRDIEMACDEMVIGNMEMQDKKAYADALVSCSIQRRVVLSCPLAFGEVGVKERVKTVLNYKKPATWIIVVALMACIITAVCFLTNPVSAQDEATGGFIKSERDGESRMENIDIENYLNEYKPFGVMMENGILKYNGKRVRYFLDGYERSDGQGGIDTVSRYKYYDENGVIDIHTVRDDVKNSDGSTTLFGSIVDIVPYPKEEFDSREYDSDDSWEAIAEAGAETSERKTDDDEISVAMGNGGNGGSTIAEMMKQYERFGITYEAIDGGRGDVFYNGNLIESFCDERPDDSVFVIHSANRGKGAAFTIYDNNVISGIELHDDTTANSPVAYAKLIAFKTNGYSQMNVREFNSLLLPQLDELLEANAMVNVFHGNENYDFINVTLRASLSELYAEQMNETAFFSGYVKKGRLSTPLNEMEEVVFESDGQIYDFLFTATYYLEYEMISPNTITIAERDNVFRAVGEELQAYIDRFSEAELSRITEEEITDQALIILQNNTPDGMKVSCEIHIDK